LLAEHFLGVCCADDDVGDGGSDADFDTGVSLLCQFTLEELVQLGIEDTICYELSPLRAVIVSLDMIHFRLSRVMTAYIAAPGTPEAILRIV
jgi:hypothetical protein